MQKVIVACRKQAPIYEMMFQMTASSRVSAAERSNAPISDITTSIFMAA